MTASPGDSVVNEDWGLRFAVRLFGRIVARNFASSEQEFAHSVKIGNRDSFFELGWHDFAGPQQGSMLLSQVTLANAAHIEQTAGHTSPNTQLLAQNAPNATKMSDCRPRCSDIPSSNVIQPASPCNLSHRRHGIGQKCRRRGTGSNAGRRNPRARFHDSLPRHGHRNGEANRCRT